MTYFFAGDGPFFFKEQLSTISWMPQIMDPSKGFGVNLLPRLWLSYPFQVIVKLFASFGFEWWLIEKIIWFLALVIGCFGMLLLARRYVGKSASYVSMLVYVTNTYALLLFGGGQMGVVLAYCSAPYVLWTFIRCIDKCSSQASDTFRLLIQEIVCGLVFALLIIFDLRLAYLIIGAVFLYFVALVCQHMTELKLKPIRYFLQTLSALVVSGIIAILLNLFWIFPMVLSGTGVSELGSEYMSPGMLNFLSVADFSHALSLLHPNWPENLFGKVYFLQPEFLFIPLVAFLALFLAHEKKKRHIGYFALLALIGTFFAKGVNDPFGGIFNWCFLHIPGFVMFRDPTKFYLFIAIGYAVLIPYTLERLGEKIKNKQWLLYVLFLVCWGYTIRPLFLGQLTGNFRPQAIPPEYIKLKNLLVADQTPSRTLWMPSAEKFAYSSDIHPILSSSDLYSNRSMAQVMELATSSAFFQTLSENGIRYVIVPSDVEGKKFMTEYKSDRTLRDHMISVLGATQLQRHVEYEQLAVFENAQFSFHSEIPGIVKKQEYWSRIGLIVDGIVFGIIVVFLLRKRRQLN